jgi:hypothetical protein
MQGRLNERIYYAHRGGDQFAEELEQGGASHFDVHKSRSTQCPFIYIANSS